MIHPCEVLIQKEDRYALLIMDLKIDDFLAKMIILREICVKEPFLLGQVDVDSHNDS
jgi:hypothetical protein